MSSYQNNRLAPPQHSAKCLPLLRLLTKMQKRLKKNDAYYCISRKTITYTTTTRVITLIKKIISMYMQIKYLLTSRELKLCSPQGFNGNRFVVVLASYRHDGLSNVNACDCSLWFSKSTSHSSLEPKKQCY